MILNQDDSLVLVIDVQEKLLNAVFNKEEVSKKSRILAKSANILNLPIIVTEQYPQGLGETIDGIKDSAKLFIKTAFNALTDDLLLKELQKSGKKQIIIWGIETHICVHQTVAALIEAGFEVTVVSDACGSRDESEYKSALACMMRNGANIKTTEMILFELLKGAKHPNFKEIQSLIK